MRSVIDMPALVSCSTTPLAFQHRTPQCRCRVTCYERFDSLSLAVIPSPNRWYSQPLRLVLTVYFLKFRERQCGGIDEAAILPPRASPRHPDLRLYSEQGAILPERLNLYFRICLSGRSQPAASRRPPPHPPRKSNCPRPSACVPDGMQPVLCIPHHRGYAVSTMQEILFKRRPSSSTLTEMMQVAYDVFVLKHHVELIAAAEFRDISPATAVSSIVVKRSSGCDWSETKRITVFRVRTRAYTQREKLRRPPDVECPVPGVEALRRAAVPAPRRSFAVI